MELVMLGQDLFKFTLGTHGLNDELGRHRGERR